MDNIFKYIFRKENIEIWIQISLWSLSNSTDVKLLFVQVMVWFWTTERHLPEQTLNQFTDTL